MSPTDRDRADADYVREKFNANVGRRNRATFHCPCGEHRHLHALPRMDESGVAEEAQGAATRMGILGGWALVIASALFVVWCVLKVTGVL